MVRIINYKKRQAEDGREFFVLEITGGIEMIKSNETGQFYATAKKATIPTTFDEETCIGLVGSDLPGKISKVEVEPYSYFVKETGEELILTHRWVYDSEESPFKEKSHGIENSLKADVESFSSNGVLASAEY